MAKKKQKSEKEIQPMPFDDALRKILSAPPGHKKAKKKRGKRK